MHLHSCYLPAPCQDYSDICGLFRSTIFFYTDLKTTRFSKNTLLSVKYVFWYSLQLLCETILILRRFRFQRHTLGADKSLARVGRKQVRKRVRDARDFNNIETLTSSVFSFQGKAPKEIHAILTETLACFLPGRTKGLTAPLYYHKCTQGFMQSVLL